jgi:hypothetical protein
MFDYFVVTLVLSSAPRFRINLRFYRLNQKSFRINFKGKSKWRVLVFAQCE